jgi:RNA polymerase sigma factor (sigma-70 family)
VLRTEDDRGKRESRFHDLYQGNYRLILAYAVRRVVPADDAGDVVAEVFATAWRRLADVPPPPGDRLWLYGVARRVIAGRRRSASRVRRLTGRLQASYHPGSQPLPGGDDLVHDRLLAAVAGLRPAEHEALLLVVWEQLSHAETAEVLGCSANAVAIRVHRAKARLRALLAPAAPDGAAAIAPEAPDGAAGRPDPARLRLAGSAPVRIKQNGT